VIGLPVLRGPPGWRKPSGGHPWPGTSRPHRAGAGGRRDGLVAAVDPADGHRPDPTAAYFSAFPRAWDWSPVPSSRPARRCLPAGNRALGPDLGRRRRDRHHVGGVRQDRPSSGLGGDAAGACDVSRPRGRHRRAQLGRQPPSRTPAPALRRDISYSLSGRGEGRRPGRAARRPDSSNLEPSFDHILQDRTKSVIPADTRGPRARSASTTTPRAPGRSCCSGTATPWPGCPPSRGWPGTRAGCSSPWSRKRATTAEISPDLIIVNGYDGGEGWEPALQQALADLKPLGIRELMSPTPRGWAGIHLIACSARTRPCRPAPSPPRLARSRPTGSSARWRLRPASTS
jgi:hypothetical protein